MTGRRPARCCGRPEAYQTYQLGTVGLAAGTHRIRFTLVEAGQVELFGATLATTSRGYPLSVAYLSLTVSGEFTLQRPDERLFHSVYDYTQATTTSTARVEDLLASTRRLFIRGEAGSGKTTLLQWIAVQSARGAFPGGLSEWNDTVPFYLALRRHADGDLPAPERFVAEAGRHIAAEMPDGWVHTLLRSGRAVVLLDVVDELSQARRDEARQWLRELVAAFPAARYVVTRLTLDGCGPLDLSLVAALPRLQWIGFGYGPLPDLRPLAELPALSRLEARGVPEVDLEPLAGREGLTVEVDRPATVHGADRLGSGSGIVRR